MYFTLQKYYPTKEQYGDTLHFCRHCSILFWKVRAQGGTNARDGRAAEEALPLLWVELLPSLHAPQQQRASHLA